jgi:hypothetical protein
MIVIMAVGGVISFFLAYSFYPKKNVNVNMGGTCYELLGSAFDQFKKLDSQRSIRVLRLQLDAIESPIASIPISFSGTRNGIAEFSSTYKINVTENNQIGTVDKYVTSGLIQKPNLEQIFENLKTIDSNRTVLNTVGIQYNSFITQQEGKEIAQDRQGFMQTGIRQIVENNNSSEINPAECRTATG